MGNFTFGHADGNQWSAWTWDAAKKERQAPELWQAAAMVADVQVPPHRLPGWVADFAQEQREQGNMHVDLLEKLSLARVLGREMAVLDPARIEIASVTAMTFTGVASTVGNVDRGGRCFLPGAFGTATKKVPLLWSHEDKQPIGSSVLTPVGGRLMHQSKLSNTPKGREAWQLIQDEAMPATSIGWLGRHFKGWRDLARQEPQLAHASAAVGVPQREDVIYYSEGEVMENSLVAIPSNPYAVIHR